MNCPNCSTEHGEQEPECRRCGLIFTKWKAAAAAAATTGPRLSEQREYGWGWLLGLGGAMVLGVALYHWQPADPEIVIPKDVVPAAPLAGTAPEPDAPPVYENKEAFFNPDIEKRVFELTNAERQKKNLPVLAWSDEAAGAARYQAQCLAENKLLAHDTVPCGTLRGRLDRYGVVYQGTENLEYIELSGRLDRLTLHGKRIAEAGGPPPGQRLAEAAVLDWMKSPRHRDNILEERVTDLGIGVHWHERRLIAVQVFLMKVPCGRRTLPCCRDESSRAYCYVPNTCDAASDRCVSPEAP